MKRKLIPDTDNVEVALIAAAIYLSEGDKADALDKRLDRFDAAYRRLRETVSGPAGVMAVIPPTMPAPPDLPEAPFMPTMGPSDTQG